MSDDPPISDKRDAAALLGWWIESGVDVATSEEARDWR